MKWSSLRKDLRQKVGLSGSQPQPASYLYPSLSPRCRTWWSWRTRVGHGVRRRIALRPPNLSAEDAIVTLLFLYLVSSAKSTYCSILPNASNLLLDEHPIYSFNTAVI
ncbi:hypothetical protein GW17_00017183 [Ensete ventricosum]|nr:hypothetical protein GW17_00017183 [Ensete ventricosum]